MAELTLQLDDATISSLEATANAAGKSLSRRIVELLEQRVRQQWPPSVTRLAGAWKDLPEIDELRAGQGVDTPREPL
jgi:Family of unknown function (DUF6364)